MIRLRMSGLAALTLALPLGSLMLSSAPVLAQTAAQPSPTQAAPTQAAPAKSAVKKTAAKSAKAVPAAGPTEESAEQASAPKVKKDPAAAGRMIESGIALLQSGKAEPAIQSLSAGVTGGNLPPSLMGRALYNRGMAYRKVSKPAQAISDLTSALWLKGGLTESERADALQQRAAAYREAGLPDQTDDNGKVAGAARGTRTAAAATPEAPAPKPASGNFLSNLFGGASASQPATPTTALVPTPAPAPAAPAGAGTPPVAAPVVASQSASEPQRAKSAATAPKAAPSPAAAATPLTAPASAPAVKTAAVTAAVAPASSAAAKLADGKFRARLALVRTKQEAETIVKRVRAEFAAAIGPRAPEVGEASFGAMGTFFQVRVGPFASMADASETCKQIKGPGLDCVAVDR